MYDHMQELCEARHQMIHNTKDTAFLDYFLVNFYVLDLVLDAV